MTAAVQTIDLRKSFGAFVVISVDFRLEHGTTCVDRPEWCGQDHLRQSGLRCTFPELRQLVLDEENVTRLRQSQRVKRGLVRTFQINQLFRRLSVLENVACVAEREGVAGDFVRRLAALH
jgi:ABC-type branched-subunit amino acid transport system ATPase component